MDKEKLRPSQERILAYTGGKMAVSATPGSGKTFTLARLAVKLLLKADLADDQEILIVTMTNSAVKNIAGKIDGLLEKTNLIPGIGYRVRTLHGLAHDILRERPDLIGLGEQFQILDDLQVRDIIFAAVKNYDNAYPHFRANYYSTTGDGRWQGFNQDKWLNLLTDTAASWIQTAKNLRATPGQIEAKLRESRCEDPLLLYVLGIYKNYQKGLEARSAVDFSDLIQLALQALECDRDFLMRLRWRWPYLLEDEAQDSSTLQEEILRVLSGNRNWVRMGDPNQAVYQSFTTASPEHLLRFLRDPEVAALDLPVSGRFCEHIRRLANFLIQWSWEEHDCEYTASALCRPLIDAPQPDDPQYHDPADTGRVHFVSGSHSPGKELNLIVSSVQRWRSQAEHEKQTCAILVPRNERGEHVVASLEKAKIPCVEMLRVSKAALAAIGQLKSLVAFLAEPESAHKLSALFGQVYHQDLGLEADAEYYRRAMRVINNLRQIEKYLFPRTGDDLLDELSAEIPSEMVTILRRFRDLVIRWLQASLLPLDQLILTFALDQNQPVSKEIQAKGFGELAIAEKIALSLERTASLHPNWRLREFLTPIDQLGKRHSPLSNGGCEDGGFDPDAYRGKVVVMTAHRAKGLEWDRVYLTSANNYDFPSGQKGDCFIGERWLKGKLINLESEALYKLEALLAGDLAGLFLQEGEATLLSREEYCTERLRLFYTAVTRARRELIVSWNTGKEGDMSACMPFTAALEFARELEGHEPAA